MTTISVKIENDLPALIGKMRREASNVVRATALKIETRAKVAVQSPPKSGRTYRRGGMSHTASAPGEAPATDTGLLVNSISTEMDGDLTAVVGVAAEYAEVLEFGGAHMAPRPFLTPALEGEREVFERAMAKVIAG